jgi:uncharacterized membrane protein (DUF485 family)
VTESNDRSVHQRSDHPVYAELERSAEFVDLRRRFRSFVVPATVAFMAWYLLYVFMSMWAHDFMSTTIVGNINVALVFGVLQFVTTFLIAWLYGRHMSQNVDPIARELNDRYNAEIGGGGVRP